MDDSSEEEVDPGDTGVIPPEHNAWVIENESSIPDNMVSLPYGYYHSSRKYFGNHNYYNLRTFFIIYLSTSMYNNF